MTERRKMNHHQYFSQMYVWAPFYLMLCSLPFNRKALWVCQSWLTYAKVFSMCLLLAISQHWNSPCSSSGSKKNHPFIRIVSMEGDSHFRSTWTFKMYRVGLLWTVFELFSCLCCVAYLECSICIKELPCMCVFVSVSVGQHDRVGFRWGCLSL